MNNTDNTNSQNASDIIPGTTWTYAEAASMAKECAREDRLFGRRSQHTRRPRVNVARSAATFLEQTGWTIEAAASMAKECLRDRRLFGGPAVYAAS